MDGNGRWAKQRGLKRYKGHQEGVNVFKEIIKESFKLGIKYISVYAFSVDNWKRDQEEINFLMKMIIKFYDTDFPYLKNNNIRVLQSGITSNLNEEIIVIDTNSYLNAVGFETQDGLHYTQKTYEIIYKYIKSQL